MNFVFVVLFCRFTFPSFFSLQLPTKLVVGTIVQKFTAIWINGTLKVCLSKLSAKLWWVIIMNITSKTAKASFFVVLAEIWLVVPSNCCSDVGRGSHGTFTHIGRSSVSLGRVLLLVILGIICHTTINFVISFSFQFLLNCNNNKKEIKLNF